MLREVPEPGHPDSSSGMLETSTGVSRGGDPGGGGMDDDISSRDLPASGDPGHSPRFGPDGFRDEIPYGSRDAARLGLDRNTVEGAELHFFSHLDPGKLSHRLVAWFVLFVMVGLPVISILLNWLRV
jgi:hypothetical protein